MPPARRLHACRQGSTPVSEYRDSAHRGGVREVVVRGRRDDVERQVQRTAARVPGRLADLDVVRGTALEFGRRVALISTGDERQPAESRAVLPIDVRHAIESSPTRRSEASCPGVGSSLYQAELLGGGGGQAPQSSRYVSSAPSRSNETASRSRWGAEAPRAPRRARARAGPRRLRRSARRGALAGRSARDRGARRPGLRLPAAQGARAGHRDTRPRGTSSSSSRSASTCTASRVSRRRARARSRAASRVRRGRAPRGARALARPRARRLPLRAVRADARSRASRSCARSSSRSASRPTSRSAATPSSSPSSRRSSRPAAARAPARPAHARALPLGPPGRRARRVPRRARDARRGARHRSRARAPRARGRDPPPGRVAPARGGAARPAGDAVPAARHDPLRRRRRVDGARRGARSRGARRVLRRYFETVSRRSTRHGGTVEKYAGDAVMAAFGIPVSHEDDALRAARAALDIRAGIAALNEQLVREHGVGLEIRIGIESGRGRRDADRRAPAARHGRGGRDRLEARAAAERTRSSSASSPVG